MPLPAEDVVFQAAAALQQPHAVFVSAEPYVDVAHHGAAEVSAGVLQNLDDLQRRRRVAAGVNTEGGARPPLSARSRAQDLAFEASERLAEATVATGSPADLADQILPVCRCRPRFQHLAGSSWRFVRSEQMARCRLGRHPRVATGASAWHVGPNRLTDTNALARPSGSRCTLGDGEDWRGDVGQGCAASTSDHACLVVQRRRMRGSVPAGYPHELKQQRTTSDRLLGTSK